MRRGKLWMMVVLGLAACVSSSIPEAEVDAARDGDSEAGSASASDAGVTDPADAGPTPAADVGAVVVPQREAGCEYLSQHFDDGVTFPSNDGCNSCECFMGSAGCSQVGCFRRPAHCDLPFDPGSCNGSHLYYAHNPSTGLCEAKRYSGCGGNLNRFREYGECAARCSLREGLSGRDCNYEGRTYRHRQRVQRQPSEMTGCGPCLCNDGSVLCPPTDCECPEGKKLGLQCVGCLADGGCEAQEERCFPACNSDADCQTQYKIFCDKAQGVCVSTPACLRP